MIFRQILHPETGCASYLFGCTGKGALAVVDPHREHVDEYHALANEAGVPIVAIIETHVQADHLSGAVVLSERTGAPIYLHEAAAVAFPQRTLRDGDEIELGNDYVRVLHTPGHSPDSICLVVGDRVRADAPWFVLTGDTLFVGDAGRPDLTDDSMALASIASWSRVRGGSPLGGVELTGRASGSWRVCSPAPRSRSSTAFVITTSCLPASSSAPSWPPSGRRRSRLRS